MNIVTRGLGSLSIVTVGFGFDAGLTPVVPVDTGGGGSQRQLHKLQLMELISLTVAVIDIIQGSDTTSIDFTPGVDHGFTLH